MNDVVTSNPVVSVIALCYNHERFAVECLDSIRGQTFTHIELIIVDDASHDQSVTIIDEWIRRNAVLCRFIKHPHNMGICKSVNEALSHATGKYVAVVATDDVWLSTKLEHQIRLLDGAPENVGVLYCNAMYIDEVGKPLGEVLPSRLFETGLREAPQGDVHLALWNGNFIPTVTALVRRSCYERVGLYDEELFYEDYDMWMRISRHYEFIFSPTVVAKYRIGYASAAHRQSDKMYHAKLQIFQKIVDDPSIDVLIRKRSARRVVELHAEKEFEERSALRHAVIWRAMRAGGGMKCYLMFICSVLGLSYNQYKQMISRMRRVAMWITRRKAGIR